MKMGGHPNISPFCLKLAAFGIGIALGSFLIGVVSLPFFFASNSVKAGVEIKQQAAKPSAPAAGADPDDFIDGNYWALIIGINKYPTMDKDKQLEAARKDAEAVSKLLIERYGFSKERMVELYDEQASRKGVIRAFSSLKRRLTDKDSLFIYYAGHGEYESTGKEKTQKEKVDGMGYWIPSDAELDDPASYIFNSQVRDYLANIPARHIYAVVDSCFSGSLMGRSRQLGRGAIKELYQSPSRWILASGGLYPVPDAADKAKQGHSTFAWHFMKLLRQNTNPYLLAKDLAEPMAIRVSNEVKDQLPRSAPVKAAGDEGGQFVFRLKREFLKSPGGAAPPPGDLTVLDKQLEEAEKALKQQQEAFEKKKQAMIERLKQIADEKKRQEADEEKLLAVAVKEAEEKMQREAKEREERLKAEAERLQKSEEERLASAKKFEQEQKEREQKAKEADLGKQKLEAERKAEAERLVAQKNELEERTRQTELARKKAEEERKAEEVRLAAEVKKREEAEKARLEQERIKMGDLRKKQEAEKDAARLAELKRQEEEARKAEEARRKAEEEKIAEEKRLAEEKKRQRQAELTRQEEERKAEAARLAELKKQEEEKERQRQVELKRQEEERQRLEAEMKAAQEREGKRLAEMKKKQSDDERRLADERRAADEKRKAEEKRLAEEKSKGETERVAALKRQEEAARKAEEERLTALARETEEQKRKLAEAKKKAEEAQRAAEQAASAKAPAEAPKNGSEPIVEATLRPFQAPKAKDLATLITIPAGEFVMGSKAGDGQPDESPQRTVYLDAYAIDKYEVMVEQYAAYLKKSGAEPPDFWDRVNQKEDGNRPVVGVDWLDAKDFCEFYGKQLPTEAQWEKAARGTDGRKYPWGNDDPGPLFANFSSGVSFSYSKSLAAVGSYESGKSPYGVYDMVGNVWEWVLDNYDKAYYQVASPKNPAGPSTSDYKVIRGGSWSKRPAVARSAGRMFLSPNTRSNSLGLRCVGEAK